MRNIHAILREDTKRRNARQVMEDAILGINTDEIDKCSDAYKISINTVKGARVNPCLVRGVGTVNPPAHTSASDNCWNRGMRGRTQGVATGTELTHKVGDPATVLVIKDGMREIRTVSSFRNKRERVSRRKSVAKVAETARLTTHHDFTTH